MNTEAGCFMFFYPFSYRQYDIDDFIKKIKDNGYSLYKIDEEQNEEKYYGDVAHVSHKTLKQYFYPFIEDKLLVNTISERHFNRFSKVLALDGIVQTEIEAIPFRLLSADLFLCPFGIGFFIMRTTIKESVPFSSALQFAHQLRILGKTNLPDSNETILVINGQRYETVRDAIEQHLAPMLPDYYVDYSYLGEAASKLPFFEDERMFVSAYVELQKGTAISEHMLYRAAQLNGYDDQGNDYISSTNDDYIKNYVNERSYTRWAPNYYLMISMHTSFHLTNEHSEKNICTYFGTQYYHIVLHYFYKMMLLKLSFEHSELKWDKDKDIVEELIEEITKFASRYYFSEVSVRSEGKELSQLARDVLRIDDQYVEIKATLDELYRVQEDRVNDRQNELLFLLTIFSMISGIYGMNLVIESLADPFDWSALGEYTLFEWIAFILLIIGISLASVLVINKIYVFIKSFINKKKRNQHR